MERGQHSNQRRITRSSNSGSNNNGNGTEAGQEGKREQDLHLPIANVTRIMRRILPQHAKVSDDAKEAIQELVSEFINHITNLANERCHREQRRTVTAEDVIWAMNKTGLTNYVGPLTLYLQKHREQEASGQRIRPNTVRPNVELGLAPPTGSAQVLPINYAPGPGYSYPHFPPTGVFYDPAVHVMMNGFNDMMNYMRSEEEIGENDGPAESSSSTATNYNDPYGHFKH
ncbi:PREDICTED: nuclear transcription factor Y subunit B-9-like [Nicotiana attenuata]|uniref:nuclear transcription factor Y subunit B-9-like n=1 Tax=Nicotiana attenuata TaxID=49451 RepID=UPI000904F99A|nr:PREDICTED: nuclear transcription factor Y subunit B-9-like [Nicotiana attenuata]